MKKLFLFLALALIVVSCDPYENMQAHEGLWYVKNMTDAPVTLAWDGSVYVDNEFTINPGEEVVVDSRVRTGGDGICTFDQLWERIQAAKNCAWLYDGDGALVDKWVWNDDAGDPDPFFDESCWSCDTEERGRNGSHTTAKWTFEIAAVETSDALEGVWVMSHLKIDKPEDGFGPACQYDCDIDYTDPSGFSDLTWVVNLTVFKYLGGNKYRMEDYYYIKENQIDPDFGVNEAGWYRNSSVEVVYTRNKILDVDAAGDLTFFNIEYIADDKFIDVYDSQNFYGVYDYSKLSDDPAELDKFIDCKGNV